LPTSLACFACLLRLPTSFAYFVCLLRLPYPAYPNPFSLAFLYKIENFSFFFSPTHPPLQTLTMEFSSPKEAIKYVTDTIKNTSADLKTIIGTREKANSLLQALSDCECCFKHTVHRPCHLNDNLWAQHLPQRRVLENGEEIWERSYRKCTCFHMEYCSFADDNDDCGCPCRHYTRIIQNAF